MRGLRRGDARLADRRGPEVPRTSATTHGSASERFQEVNSTGLGSPESSVTHRRYATIVVVVANSIRGSIVTLVNTELPMKHWSCALSTS